MNEILVTEASTEVFDAHILAAALKWFRFKPRVIRLQHITASLLLDFRAIMITGEATMQPPLKLPSCLFESNTPVLGIDAGLHAIASHFGNVDVTGYRQYKKKTVALVTNKLFEDMGDMENTTEMWMPDRMLTKVSSAFNVIAREHIPGALDKLGGNIVAIKHRELPVWGVQCKMHGTPHTFMSYVAPLHRNFLSNICGIYPSASPNGGVPSVAAE